MQRRKLPALPTPSTVDQRSAQDYTFEALHRVYFYDAWRVQPVLDAPGSELVLPPRPGLLVQGCYWPQPNATPEVLSVSDRKTEKEEHDVQEGQPLSSPVATDATMADDEVDEAVSVHSSASESPTIQLLLKHFFPRVRTPCGHGAQVIVEGREKQSDGGEKNKDHKHNPKKPQQKAHRPSLHHHVVFPLC